MWERIEQTGRPRLLWPTKKENPTGVGVNLMSCCSICTYFHKSRSLKLLHTDTWRWYVVLLLANWTKSYWTCMRIVSKHIEQLPCCILRCHTVAPGIRATFSILRCVLLRTQTAPGNVVMCQGFGFPQWHCWWDLIIPNFTIKVPKLKYTSNQNVQASGTTKEKMPSFKSLNHYQPCRFCQTSRKLCRWIRPKSNGIWIQQIVNVKLRSVSIKG